MARYHQKLVFTQNISLALKMTDDMPDEEKAACKKEIINRITTDINKYLSDNTNN